MTRAEVQQKLTQIILERSNCVIEVSIRLGKTKITLDALRAGDKVLWLYPRNSMKSDYEKDIKKFPPQTTDITFSNISSVKNFKNTSWDVVVVDEVQECMSLAQMEILKTISFKRRIGLSGTIAKKTQEKLKELAWPIVARYSLESAIRDGLVKDYNIVIQVLDLDNQSLEQVIEFGNTPSNTKRITEKGMYKNLCETIQYYKLREEEERKEGEYRKASYSKLMQRKFLGMRARFLYNSTTLLNYTTKLIEGLKDQKAIIYTKLTSVADKLGTKAYHSKKKEDSMLEEFKDSRTGHLVAVNCVTTGVTFRHLNWVVFHAYDSNPETFVQKLGRSLLWEVEGEVSNILITCLKDTQMEHWLDKACSTLSLDKLQFEYQGKRYSKTEWFRLKYPDKDLYLVKATGKVVWYSGEGDYGQPVFSFPSSPETAYSYKLENLQRIA